MSDRLSDSPHIAHERPAPKPYSRFLQQTLLDDERIVSRAEFHWVYTFRAFLVAVLWIAVGIAIQFGLHKLAASSHDNSIARYELIPPLFGLVVGGFSFLAKMIYKWTTEIVLTDKRFLYKSGVFSILVYKMNVREINYCNIMQSLLGNWLDYGHVYIITYTLDDKNIFLPNIAGPHTFSTAIEQVKKAEF